MNEGECDKKIDLVVDSASERLLNALLLEDAKYQDDANQRFLAGQYNTHSKLLGHYIDLTTLVCKGIHIE